MLLIEFIVRFECKYVLHCSYHWFRTSWSMLQLLLKQREEVVHEISTLAGRQIRVYIQVPIIFDCHRQFPTCLFANITMAYDLVPIDQVSYLSEGEGGLLRLHLHVLEIWRALLL
jgi:hypothetical protein